MAVYLQKQTFTQIDFVKYQIVTCGEKIPEGLMEPKIIDAERRICEIYCHLYQSDNRITKLTKSTQSQEQLLVSQNKSHQPDTKTYTYAQPNLKADIHQAIQLRNHLQVLEEVYWFSHKGYLAQAETKVKFPSGSSGLSEWNKEHLEHLIIQIKESVNTHRLYFPDEKINLLIEVKGYTDAKPFYPNQDISERENHNQALAQKRADKVLTYLKNQTERYVDTFEYATLAYGEDIPYWHKEAKTVDAERRICEVYCLLYNGERRTHLKFRLR